MRQRVESPPAIDCVEMALRRSPRRITVTRTEQPDDGFDIAIPDTTARGGQRHAAVELETDRESPPALTMRYSWMGFGGKVPLDEQERMLALATGVLEELRAACAPNATTKVECFSGGLGGPSACPRK
jgi:hypothetical protein